MCIRPRHQLIQFFRIVSPVSIRHVENEKTTGCAVLSQKISFDEAIEEYERKIIQEAYAKYKSSRKLAENLQMSQSKVNRLIQKYIMHVNE